MNVKYYPKIPQVQKHNNSSFIYYLNNSIRRISMSNRTG